MEQGEREHLAQQYFQLAYQHQMRGELDAAIAYYKRSLDMHATAEAHTFLGWAYSAFGRYDDAIDECQKAISIDPDFGNPYNDIGAYLIEKGQLDEAMSYLQRAMQAKRYESYCFPHYNLGRIWERRGEWWKAIEEYKTALAENPEYALAAAALRRLRGRGNGKGTPGGL